MGNHCPEDVLCASEGNHQSQADAPVQTWKQTGGEGRINIDQQQRQHTLPIKSL